MTGQREGKSGEDELRVLCEGAVCVGSISVRTVACVRGDESFRGNAHEEALQRAL